jgi:hypothetical protein
LIKGKWLRQSAPGSHMTVIKTAPITLGDETAPNRRLAAPADS